MEFLDSLDLDTKDRKSNRMRSWYLYEQYRSLEKHQLDAAQKLKDKSYQDKLLRQELSERRARRKLYDHVGPCQSESRIQKRIRSSGGHSEPHSVSNDEFFESFSEQEDCQEEERVTHETEFENEYSQQSTSHLSTSNCSNETDDMKSSNDQNDNGSYSESMNSVVENTIPNDDCTDCEFTIESEFTTMIIAQDIHKQLDGVKQNILGMEDVGKLQDEDDDGKQTDEERFSVNERHSEDQILSDNESLSYCEILSDNKRASDIDSVSLADGCLVTKDSIKECKKKKFNNIVVVWTRLVSFAYQIVQLNHGNCYCDYSSQFLTAVLACDVLRRGVNRMCRILQPYVSPTMCATDDESECCHKHGKNKKSVQSRKSRKTFENKLFRRRKRTHKLSKHAHRKYSENTWQPSYRRSSYEPKKPRHTSETLPNPYRRFYGTSSSSSSSIWADNYKKKMSNSLLRSRCCCHKRPMNPMLELARYIDSILKDTDNL